MERRTAERCRHHAKRRIRNRPLRKVACTYTPTHIPRSIYRHPCSPTCVRFLLQLGGCSPNGTHTPYPSEYGFDHTGTYGSPVYGHCSGTAPTAKDEVASKAVAAGQTGKDPWWSSDVGDYIRDRGIAHMSAATKAHKPFYLHLWWHMSHDRIDPRPEQYNVTYPFKETYVFLKHSQRKTKLRYMKSYAIVL